MVKEIIVDESAFTTSERSRLIYRVYSPGGEGGSPAEVKATMFVAHGLGEHSGRYINVVEKLVPLGYKVVIHDHRGHGNSSGTRGHVLSWNEYVDDFKQVMNRIGRAGERTIVLGHSMGALIATRFVQEHPDMADALVVSGPFYKLTVEVPKIKEVMGKLVSKIWPSLTMANELDPKLISHDEEVVQAYIDDPLVHDKVSARWFTEAMKELELVNENAPEIKMPMLLMHGSADELCAPECSREMYEKIGSEKKELKIYDGMYHEIFNEVEKEKPLRDLAEWLDNL